jgi:hypothetical protein
VSVVVARWSNDLFIILLLLNIFVLMLMIINKSVEFCKKKKLVLSVWAEGRSLLQIDNGILDQNSAVATQCWGEGRCQNVSVW